MILSRELFFCLSKNSSFIYTGLFENWKARFLKSKFTWSEMGQQTVLAKEVYYYIIATMKIDRVQMTSFSKAGLQYMRLCDLGHKKVSVVRFARCPNKAG